jgi:translation initiation factor 5B
MQIQDKNETVKEATIGMRVAVSMREPIVGRHFNEGDILYVAVPEEDVKVLLKTIRRTLPLDDLQILEELMHIMRKNDPLWGL